MDVGIGSLIGAIMILDIKSMPPVSISQNHVEEGMTRLPSPMSPAPYLFKKDGDIGDIGDTSPVSLLSIFEKDRDIGYIGDIGDIWYIGDIGNWRHVSSVLFEYF